MEPVSSFWMALYTLPRQEKKVFDKLHSKGITAYLPLRETIRQWSDRRKKIKVPLFTSYVFVRIPEANRSEVLHIPGVRNFVFWQGKPARIRDIEIERIRYFLKEAGTQNILLETLQPGDHARIQSGLFKDEDIIIEDVSAKEYLTYLPSLGLRLRISKLDVIKTDA